MVAHLRGGLIIGMLMLSVMGCQGRGEGTARVASGAPAPTDPARVDARGGVQVTVVPIQLSRGAEQLVFEVALDTHSIDLSFDLAAQAILRNDQGRTVQALFWDGGQGGHHLRGRLSFPARDAAGAPLLGPETRALELVLVGIAGVQERIFRWEVSP